MIKHLTNLFLVILLISAVSAATLSLENTSIIPTTVESGNSFSVTYKVSYESVTSETVSVTWSLVNPIGTATTPSAITLDSNTFELVTVTYTVPSGSSGTYSSTLTANTNTALTASKSLSSSIVTPTVSGSTLCKNGIQSSDLLEIEYVKDDSNVEDEWEWRPLDDIEISVKIRNNGDDDNVDYTLRLYFVDSDGKDVSDRIVDDEDLLEEDINNLDSGDSEKITFEFPIDIDADADTYKLFAKLIKEGKESEQCVVLESEDDPTIDKNNRQIVIEEVEGPITVSCGQTADLTARVVNIGEEDEDQVKVILYNRELGVSEFHELSNFDSGDSEEVLFTFTVPTNVEEKLYRLEFSSEYDYDDRDDNYDEVSESEDDFTKSINVLGKCVNSNGDVPSVAARLVSEAKSGEELTFEVTISNNYDKSAVFVVGAENYNSWANSLSQDKNVLSLNAGSSDTVIFTLQPTDAGQKSLVVTVQTSDGQTHRQTVSVNVAEKSGFGSLSGSSLTNYLIIGIIVLVILIVVVLIIKNIVASNSRRDE